MKLGLTNRMCCRCSVTHASYPFHGNLRKIFRGVGCNQLEDCKMCGPSGYPGLTKVALLSSRRHPVAKVPGAMQVPVARDCWLWRLLLRRFHGEFHMVEAIFGLLYITCCLL